MTTLGPLTVEVCSLEVLVLYLCGQIRPELMVLLIVNTLGYFLIKFDGRCLSKPSPFMYNDHLRRFLRQPTKHLETVLPA